MVFSNNLLMGAAGQGGGYEIDQSIRFNSADSAYLTRSPSSTGDQKKWTTSFWFKRCKTGAIDYLMTAGQSSTNNGVCAIYVHSDDTIHTYFDTTGSNPSGSVNARKFRDPSAWYHFIWAVDAVNTVQKIWVNGEELSLDAGKNPPNFAYDMNATGSSKRMSFAAQGGGAVTFANIYAAEIHHLDGQYITDPTTFGKYNDSGVWVPIEVSGVTYGTNGFYITGETAADLGEDFSGNSNDFTSSGLTTADQVTDTPTGNYATWNPLRTGANITPSDGNLKAVTSATVAQTTAATFGLSSGKWYWEVTNEGGSLSYTGIVDETHDMSTYIGSSSSGNGYAYNTSGEKVGPTSGTTASYGATYTTGNVIGIALDMDAGTLAFYKNGASQGTAFTGLTGTWFPAVSGNGVAGKGGVADFGQLGFTHTPPTGFKALSTANLPTPAITDGSKYFQTTLYTGNGTAIGSGGKVVSQSEKGRFQPDFVWIKGRSGATEHVLTDAVRGVTKELSSNDTGAEETVAQGLTTFGSSGFTVGSDGSYNTSSATYAAWQWLAANGTASNEDGSINTTATSANTTAGFSISTYTGNATSGATIGHGLGVAPDVIIVKNRDAADAWQVYHSGVASDPATDYLVLNTTAASADNVNRWNDTAPTSSVFSLGNAVEVNTNTEDYVAYCFAGVDGFSKFGSYTGNGSTDGPFIFTGFKPAFVVFKKTNATDSWEIFDNTRPGYNATGLGLFANTTASESTGRNIDILSNGIKQRNANATTNESGQTYIYMAFAENPFGGTGAAPATAR